VGFVTEIMNMRFLKLPKMYFAISSDVKTLIIYKIPSGIVL